jgi:hypothetical protein
MDSDADSSNFLPLPTIDSVQTESKKGRTPTAHITWAHTRPAHDGETQFYKKAPMQYCIYCTESVYGTSVTTNMRNHLKSKHQISIDPILGPLQQATIDQLDQLYLKAASSGQTQGIDTQAFQRILNQDIIDEALALLIVVRNLPFHLVEWPEFHTFCQVLNPESKSYIITAHSSIPRRIEQSWQAQKDIVRKKLQSAISSIHLSLDIWTSPNRLLFLGICAHFVEQSQEKLSKALLALRTVVNHSGDEQFTTLLPVLKDYGIVQKLGSIVCDNHTANDKLCRTVAKYLKEEEEIKWDPTYRRIFCIGHVINLAVQAFLFRNVVEIEQLSLYDEEAIEEEEEEEVILQRRAICREIGPLGKLHNIVIHIRGSAGRTKEFKDLAGRLIPLDNRTRWNSWYHMLHIALQHESAIDTYAKKYFDTLQAEYLSPIDWEKLRTTSKFLSLFDHATLKTQGDQATIDNVLLMMDAIIRHFEKALVSLLYLNR